MIADQALKVYHDTAIPLPKKHGDFLFLQSLTRLSWTFDDVQIYNRAFSEQEGYDMKNKRLSGKP